MAVTKKKNTGTEAPEVHWPFGTKNYVLFGVALAVLIIGFYQLDAGDITLAPILLVLGFCVLIPAAIMVDGLPKADSAESTDSVE